MPDICTLDTPGNPDCYIANGTSMLHFCWRLLTSIYTRSLLIVIIISTYFGSPNSHPTAEIALWNASQALLEVVLYWVWQNWKFWKVYRWLYVLSNSDATLIRFSDTGSPWKGPSNRQETNFEEIPVLNGVLLTKSTKITKIWVCCPQLFFTILLRKPEQNFALGAIVLQPFMVYMCSPTLNSMTSLVIIVNS